MTHIKFSAQKKRDLPLKASLQIFMGDRRIELLTSSVSRKRSTSELTTLKGKTKGIIPNFAPMSNQAHSQIKVSDSQADI